jgi:hypothetical protein
MLDTFYPSWSALIADLRSIRSYLRSPESVHMSDSPEDYSLSKIRSHFEERVYVKKGQFCIGLFCVVA